jgi:hypothetical protein
MVKAVRIYVEGGGDGKNSKLHFRIALNAFFKQPVSIARTKRIRWDVAACGSRNDTHNGFSNDNLLDDPDAAVVMLVDSEGPVTDGHTPKQHLQRRDNWDLRQRHDDQCHLMVEMMEAWFLADVDALADYYGANFSRTSIPRRDNVEQIQKQDVTLALERATRHVQKGSYHKGQHSHELLKLISPDKVRKRASHCDKLFEVLGACLGEKI